MLRMRRLGSKLRRHSALKYSLRVGFLCFGKVKQFVHTCKTFRVIISGILKNTAEPYEK